MCKDSPAVVAAVQSHDYYVVRFDKNDVRSLEACCIIVQIGNGFSLRILSLVIVHIFSNKRKVEKYPAIQI